MSKARLGLVVLLVSLISRNAPGYGPIGHQIVGAIADERLANTPTGLKIARLLDGFTLQKAAVIPDEIRGWDKKGADDPNIFHYSSRPRIDAQLRDFWGANPPTRDLRSPIPSHHWFHYTDVPLIPAQKYGDGKAGRSRWDIVHAMRYCIAVLKGDEPEDNSAQGNEAGRDHPAGAFRRRHPPAAACRRSIFQRARRTNRPRAGQVCARGSGRKYDQPAPLPGGHGEDRCCDLKAPHVLGPPCRSIQPARSAEGDVERRTPRAHRQARDALVDEFVRREPANWKLQEVALESWPEAWANEILPLAREAHDRLRFSGVHRQVDEENHAFAVGNADEIAAPDGVPYANWAAGVVRQQMHKAGWRLAELLEKALQ